MKITGLAIIPPPGAARNPHVTPELLASCLAKYSRSNKGIEDILAAVDWQDPDAAVDRIFKFVDYGHASIGGMTGGIAVTIDGLSMLLALKLFNIAQLCDGQESSTRYIEMHPASLPRPADIGMPAGVTPRWTGFMERAFAIYGEVYRKLDADAEAHPELVRIPAAASEKAAARMRKNYALDRARYLIPLATKTNAAFVMTARIWAESIRQLDSLPWPEARRCAELLRAELEKFIPRLIRHSYREDAAVEQALQFERARSEYIRAHGMQLANLPDEVYVGIEDSRPPFLPSVQSVPQAFAGKRNRYSLVGERIARSMVRVAWNNISLAELRDLNRHRSGFRFAPLFPVGFYLPPEVSHPGIPALLEEQRSLVEELARSGDEQGALLYAFLLGVQTPFEHSMHADKFIYEVELRTGLGAHYRYAQHLAAACTEFLKQLPEAREFIRVGAAEPE